MDRPPIDTQTLYAESLAQLLATASTRSPGRTPGCFTTKIVKKDAYYYFQYSDPGGCTRQAYIGKKTAVLDAVVRRFQQERIHGAADTVPLQLLCAQLRIGGAAATETAPARVLKALADAAIFRLGGVLIGTHAFAVLENLLGVRWRGVHLKTQDIDTAGETQLDIVLPDLHTDAPKMLDSLQMGFLPVPPLNRKHPSTSFKVRGSALRVDFVTPAKRQREEKPVFIRRFNVAAQPLKYLDYLLEAPQPAGIVAGEGVLVNVPNPARYALHKMLISRARSLTDQTKAEKDLAQASELLDALVEDRPGELALAWNALEKRNDKSADALRSRLPHLLKHNPRLYTKLEAAIPAVAS
jgi:hypothetical protein